MLLFDKEEVSLQNIEKQTQMNQRLAYTVVSQLSTTFQHLVDTVGVSLNKKESYKTVREEVATAEQDFALLIFLHDFGTQADNVSNQSVVVLFGKTLYLHAGVDDELKNLFLFLGVSDLFLEKSQTIASSVLRIRKNVHRCTHHRIFVHLLR